MITESVTVDLKEFLSGYIESFKTADQDIKDNLDLKKYHTERVVNNALRIAESIELDETDTKIVEVVALLHDIGRFPQFAKYKTFSDADSIDHAKLGIEVIEENDLLKAFDEEVASNIKEAIINHSARKIPAKCNDKVLLYSKIIRDADKLDIYKVMIDHYKSNQGRAITPVTLDLPISNTISDKVFKAAMSKQQVDKNSLQSLSDFKVLQMAWIYDMNFKQSFKIVNENNYLKSIYETLPKNDRVIDIYREVKIFMENQFI
ncbi:HD domain-containing protein [Puteibacter caeruleilacunae]|nr:HD domain-containing protein [Puteibacter caeruleilacunae]